MDLGNLAFVAIGSNMGASREIVLAAMECLQAFNPVPMRKSSLWESTPVDCPPGSSSFVNAVVGLIPEQGQSPEALLEKLKVLEKEFGREPKKILNEPRNLDLDLIAFGSETRATDHLTLPHPRAHLRRFVLQPLCEIAPQLVLPKQTKSVAEFLMALKTDELLKRIE